MCVCAYTHRRSRLRDCNQARLQTTSLTNNEPYEHHQTSPQNKNPQRCYPMPSFTSQLRCTGLPIAALTRCSNGIDYTCTPLQQERDAHGACPFVTAPIEAVPYAALQGPHPIQECNSSQTPSFTPHCKEAVAASTLDL